MKNTTENRTKKKEKNILRINVVRSSINTEYKKNAHKKKEKKCLKKIIKRYLKKVTKKKRCKNV